MKMGRVLIMLVAAASSAVAQDASKSLASTLDVYVFPSEGQDSAQQSKDESACYDWAVGNAGVDPFDLAKKTEADASQSEAEMAAVQQSGQGAGARGAVKGAAAGALIGEIASDDASEGAAWGAAAGLIHGRRAAREAKAEAQQEVAQESGQKAALSAEQLDNFKKAFSVCLEAKKYLVKY